MPALPGRFWAQSNRMGSGLAFPRTLQLVTKLTSKSRFGPFPKLQKEAMISCKLLMIKEVSM